MGFGSQCAGHSECDSGVGREPWHAPKQSTVTWEAFELPCRPVAPQRKGGISQTNDERFEEVRFGHTSDESGEQRSCGVGGAKEAKGRTQEQSGRPKLVPRAGAGKQVTGGKPDTKGCKEESARASRCAPAPFDGPLPSQCISFPKEGYGGGCEWRHVGRVCARVGHIPKRFSMFFDFGCLRCSGGGLVNASVSLIVSCA